MSLPSTASPTTHGHPALATLLRRGLARACPRCGRGPLFVRFVTLEERCAECGLIYETSPGSTWGFWVIGDRVFVVLMLLPIYLGLSMESVPLRAAMFGAVAVGFVATMPMRQGLCTALDYWTRLRWGDPASEALIDPGNPGDAGP